MNTFGKNIRISIFGESHGKCIGITIDGIPSNLTLDEELIKRNLKLRHSNKELSTPRIENDEYIIISGYFNNKTTGAPLTFIIPNNDVDSSKYTQGIIRPNHSDYPMFVKFNGCNDYRGGGQSSGRLTALLIIVGSICEQILKEKNIKVSTHLKQILDIVDDEFNHQTLSNEHFMYNQEKEKEIFNLIKKSIDTNDSLPSKLETFVEGVNAGIGEPFFDSFESILSHLLFSIPGLKAVSFGDENLISLKGSMQIDNLQYENDNVTINTSHQGGINGGITNGGLIKFTSTFKAPASINKPLKSINVKTKENILVTTTGRHDPIIGIRAIPVINSVTYYVLYDLLIEANKHA